MKRLLALLLILSVLLSACNQTNQQAVISEVEVDIYYPTKGNEGLGTEKRDIEYKDINELYTKTIQEYLKGPQDEEKFEGGYANTSSLLNIIIKDSDITINLSREFNIFSGVLHEAAVIASFVNTMVQFEEINRVRLLVEGKDLIAPSGVPYGFLEYTDFIADGNTAEIILYFANSQATHVVAEKRIINIKKDADKEELLKRIVEELIKGPAEENLYKTIPEQVRVNNLSIEDNLVRIDFSEEMHTKHSRGAAGEYMTISSLVNTITEVEGINKVLPTVAGQPLSIEHEYVIEPLERREERIYRQ